MAKKTIKEVTVKRYVTFNGKESLIKREKGEKEREGGRKRGEREIGERG